MMTLMKNCLIRQGSNEEDNDGDEGVKDLVEITLRRMDQDRDGRVSYNDFRYAKMILNLARLEALVNSSLLQYKISKNKSKWESYMVQSILRVRGTVNLTGRVKNCDPIS